MTFLTCRTCGNEFEHTRAPGTRGRLPGYCSPACRTAARTAYHAEYAAERARHRREGELCVHCPDAAPTPALPGTRFCTDHTENRNARRIRVALKQFGLTAEEHAALYEQQGGKCAICGTTEDETGRRFAIDHDHACCAGNSSCGACVRGLLCRSCNLGLGTMRDRADLLRAAANYVERERREA